MEQEKKKKILYTILALVVLIVVAIAISYIAGNTPRNIGNVVISGIVEQKNGNVLVVDAITLRGVAGNSQDQKILKTVTFDSTTLVKKQIQKDISLFEKEQAIFLESQKTNNTKTEPPLPFIEERVEGNTITIGDFVTIRANKNVEEYNEFLATSIIINNPSSAPKFSDIPNIGAPKKVVGVVGWKADDNTRFAVDKGDGTRVQIKISSNTIFSKQGKKSDTQFKEETEAYKNGTLVTIPVPFIDEPSDISNFQVGDAVEVQGIGDEIQGIHAERATLLLSPEN
ncbi:hypothetical protein C4565_07525 [Candidatus Parcubacteria bacterium]|jgi:hypothetical protein|nr:MAG: hypothetical protein C4565_07525 [Candidatus Parcubacteria bacterium]